MSAEYESSAADHERDAANVRPLRFAVITLSDTRTEETDQSGLAIQNLIAAKDHATVFYTVTKDDPDAIRVTLEKCLSNESVDIVVTNGGTGIAKRDSAYEVISELIEKRLDGFGELFRMLSYEEIGTAAMLSRAVGGIARNKVLFALPGSTNAVKLGMNRLILPQAAHLHQELQKHA